MESEPDKISPLHDSLRFLFEEDERRKNGEYGSPMESMFGTMESEAMGLAQQCFSETDSRKIASLFQQISNFILRHSSSRRLIESVDSLQNIHSILSNMATQLSVVGIEPRDYAIDSIASFVAWKCELLMDYHSR